MTSSSRWLLIGAFALMFLAGLAVGCFTSPFFLRHRAEHRIMADQMLNRLDRQLHLTPEQREKIKPITERTAAQLRIARREMGQHVRDILTTSHREIIPLLTPEQQAKLQRLEQRHRERMHRGSSPRPQPSPA